MRQARARRLPRVRLLLCPFFYPSIVRPLGAGAWCGLCLLWLRRVPLLGQFYSVFQRNGFVQLRNVCATQWVFIMGRIIGFIFQIFDSNPNKIRQLRC